MFQMHHKHLFKFFIIGQFSSITWCLEPNETPTNPYIMTAHQAFINDIFSSKAGNGAFNTFVRIFHINCIPMHPISYALLSILTICEVYCCCCNFIFFLFFSRVEDLFYFTSFSLSLRKRNEGLKGRDLYRDNGRFSLLCCSSRAACFLIQS